MTIHRPSTHRPVMPHGLRRRHQFPVIVAVLVMGVLVSSGCGGDDGQRAEQEGAVTEYVGTVRGVDPQKDFGPGDFFVAVAIDEDGNAEAYMCDGTGNAQLFQGKVEGARLNLRSKTGQATLTASVADSRVTGNIALEGERLPFATTAARGVGGLYTFTKSQEYKVTARSERGNEVSGKFLPDEQALEGTVTPAGGEERRFKASLRPRSQAQARASTQQSKFRDFRVVLLDSQDGRGNKTVTSRVGSGGTNFSCCMETDF